MKPKTHCYPSQSLSLTSKAGTGVTWRRRRAEVWGAALTPRLHTCQHCLSSTSSFNQVEQGRAKLPGKGNATGKADMAESSLENLCLIFLLCKVSFMSFLHPSVPFLVLTQSQRNRVKSKSKFFLYAQSLLNNDCKVAKGWSRKICT